MVQPSGQTTRDRILQAARDLIVEIGWAEVTTRRISERAGVNNALIHYYFGTKDALLLAAAAASFEEEIGGPLAAMTSAGSVSSGLREMLNWLHSAEARAPTMVIVMEAAHQAVRDERVGAWIREQWNAYFESFAALLAEGQARGEVNAGLDPKNLALTIGGLIDGLFLYRLVGVEFDVDETMKAVGGLLNGAVEGAS